MAKVYPDDVNSAIVSTLKQEKVKGLQDLGDFTEAMNSTPAVQVYPDSGALAQSTGAGSDRVTFGGKIRHNRWTFHIDIYARQRANIAIDLVESFKLLRPVLDVLDSQTKAPYFGLEGIQSFTYRWERVTFTYGSEDHSYAGVRVMIDLSVY